jgi:predicted metal-dependent hydrolase
MPKIKLSGQTIEYSIRESKRAKSINIRVDARKGLELVYPLGITDPPPKEVLQIKEKWILSALGKMQIRAETRVERRYEQGAIFPYLGEDITLNLIQKANGKNMSVQLRDSQLELSLPPEIDLNDTKAIQHAVESFYRKQAKWYITNRTIEIADKLDFKFNRIVIKNQKTRWGSCSTGNNLNFNLRLMMTPPEAIDYIIIHELCHLTHMNHSKQFWNLVGKHCPDYTYWRKWFKENSRFLVL